MRSQPAIIALTVLAFLTTFLGLPLLTFLPVFARDIFHGDVGRYSEMMAFSGAGAVVGALIVAWLGRFKHMGLTLLLVQLAFGVLMTAFALSRIAVAERPAAVLRRRGAADRLLDDHVAGAADRPRSPARPRREHLHGGVPRRHAARQPRGGYAATLSSAPYVLAINGVLVSLVALYFLVRSHGVREL